MAGMLDGLVTITLISRRFRKVTWLDTSAFALYLIPSALKWLLGNGSRNVPHHIAALSRAIIGCVFLTLGLYRRATREWIREVDHRTLRFRTA